MRSTASIMHLDLDAFFASVEQRDKPSLARPAGHRRRHRPPRRRRDCVLRGTRPRRALGHAYGRGAGHGARTRPSSAAGSTPTARPAGSSWSGFARSPRSSSRCRSTRRSSTWPPALTSIPTRVEEVVAGIRADIAELTGGLTASVGVASSKLMAKIASEINKPDGVFIVEPGTEADVLGPMQATVIPGVGPATAERLRRVGILTVEDLRSPSEDELVRLLGQSSGRSLHRMARADDDRPVMASRETKSVSVEDTFEQDISDRLQLEAIIERMARSVVGPAPQERPVGSHRDAQDAPPRLRDPHPVVDAAQPDRQRTASWPRRRAGCWPARTSATGCACSASGSAGSPTGSRTTCSPPTRTTIADERARRGGRRTPARGGIPAWTCTTTITATAGCGAPAWAGSRSGSRPAGRRPDPVHTFRADDPALGAGHTGTFDVMNCARLPRRRAPAHRPQPPRRRLRRRLRVAARQGGPGDAGLPRGGERLHRCRHGAPRAAAPADLRRDQGAHARDRPLGARSGAARGGTTPARSRASSTRSGAAARSTTPTTGTRRCSRPTPRSPASRSCSTPTSRPRGTSSSRSARSASATTRTCWPGRSTPRATSATRSGSRTCAPARCCPTRSRRPAAARPGRPAGRTSSTRRSTMRGALTACGGTGSAPPPRTCWCSRSPTSATSSASGAPSPSASSSSDSRPRSPARCASSRPTIPRASSGSCSPAVTASSTPSSTPSSAARTSSSSCTTTARSTSSSPPCAVDDPSARTVVDPRQRVDPARGRRRVRQAARRVLPPRRALPHRHHAAGRRRARRAHGDRLRRGAVHERRRRQRRVGPAAHPRRCRLVHHAGVDLRLRRRDRRADPAQAGARARRLRPGRLRAAPQLGRSPTTASACRSRSCAARTRRATAPLRR